MPDEQASSAETKARNKVLVISFVGFVLGLMGVSLFAFLHSKNQIWESVIDVLQHSSEILSSVGLIGLLLELAVRRELVAEIEYRIKIFFRVDREVIELLGEKARKDIVSNTLRAHLGDDLGLAIFSGVVNRYFEDQNSYRTDASYEISMREMECDRAITAGGVRVIFPASDYFQVTAKYHFHRKLLGNEQKAIAVIFDNNWEDLIDKFRLPYCFFREMLPLFPQEVDPLFQTLRNGSGPLQLSRLCRVEVEIGGNRLQLTPPTIEDRSVTFRFDTSKVRDPGLIRHKIEINSLIAKSACSYSILVTEPTRGPEFEFNFPESLQVKVEHFFTGAQPFDVMVDKHIPGRRTVSMKSRNPDESWVFPNSGVNFSWNFPPSKNRDVRAATNQRDCAPDES
ncbi:MAG TPA: hypothetical protein VMA34_06455 [Terracidiphilus sp.]|nr:hypothetical protein [Terracidiphilus sp.]